MPAIMLGVIIKCTDSGPAAACLAAARDFCAATIEAKSNKPRHARDIRACKVRAMEGDECRN
eukprot:CAMPEP_0172853738 /NCGR_PEP_ID=MMETSP1075-20121228/57326_1 /TAXON_ID=2916 /ORGANISM="Ceratium fusus, Strain PA161109" /LENGTH=61 /DNA_ID=CAMNT_0013700293 /DNA_START=171 /DNA_END=356 /DNA_ORIENTATION=+